MMSGGQAPQTDLVCPDLAKEEIFVRLLQQLPKHGAFNNPNASSVFVVYAHDVTDSDIAANANCVMQLIRWLEKASVKILSDMSPQPQYPKRKREGGAPAPQNIVQSQLCLLPERAGTRPSDFLTSVDHVILCGSPLLRSYYHHHFTASFIDAVKTSYGVDDSEDHGARKKRICDLVENSCLEPGFHHVLTELALLDIRCSADGSDDCIIPIFFRDEGNDLEYLTFLEKANIRHKSAPDVPSLRMLLFKLLQRLHPDEQQFVTDIRTRYEEAVKRVDATEQVLREDVENISRDTITQMVEDRWSRIQLASQYSKSRKNEQTGRQWVKECMQSLAFKEMRARLDDVKPAAKGTCEWLLEHAQYRDWASSHGGPLWIKGHPGTGKSTLLRYALDNDHPRDTITLSFFFHGGGGELERMPLGLFRALLHQLGRKAPDSLANVVQTFKERLENEGPPGDKWNWNRVELTSLFTTSLRKALQTFHVRIFVDALDESGDTNAVEVFQDFKTLVENLSSSPMHLDICLSSRHYPILNKTCPYEINPEHENGKDIAEYVHSRLSGTELSTFSALITSKAERSFIWSRLIMDLITHLDDEGHELDEIEKQIYSIPQDLTEAYRKLTEEADDEAVALIRWITFSLQPLSPNELRWALLVDAKLDTEPPIKSLKDCQPNRSVDYTPDLDPERMKRKIQRLSRGLVEVTDNDNTVQFVHQSARDFFLKNRPGKATSETNWEGMAHYRMSRVCIRYFGKTEVSERMEDLSLDSDSEFDTDGDDSLEFFPLLGYALESWSNHTKRSERKGIDQCDILDSKHFKWPSEALSGLWVKAYQTFLPLHSWPTPGTVMLHIVSKFGLVGPLKEILSAPNRERLDINVRDGDSRSALSYAAETGHGDVVELLLLHQDVLVDPVDTRWGQTPLLIAAENGHTAIVRLLLDGNAKVNSVDDEGQTPLSKASENGHTSIVKLLLERDAEVNVTDKDGRPPLSRVAGHTEVATLLLDNDAEVNLADKCAQTPLWIAAEHGQMEVVALLLENSAEVNSADIWLQTPLLIAAKNGHIAVVKSLLERGAEIDSTDKWRQTPLMKAAEFGHIAVVKLILERAADVDVVNEWGETPVMKAAEFGHTAVSKMLLDEGAKVNTHDRWGESPLSKAAMFGHTAIVELLLDGGANVDSTNDRGVSPLWLAARAGHREIVQALLNRRANIELADEYGVTAIFMAIVEAHTEVALLLLRQGANLDFYPHKSLSRWICRASNEDRKRIINSLYGRGYLLGGDGRLVRSSTSMRQ